MGFWTGVQLGLQDKVASEERAQDAKLRQEENERRKRAEERAEQQFSFSSMQQRYELVQKISKDLGLNRDPGTPQQQSDLKSLAAMIAGTKGSEGFLAKVALNPTMASTIIGSIRAAQKDSDGMFKPSGEDIMALYQVTGGANFSSAVSKYSTTGEIMSAIEDPTGNGFNELLQATIENARTSQPIPSLVISSEVYEGTDFDMWEKQEKYYNTQLKNYGEQALLLASKEEDQTEYSLILKALGNSKGGVIDPYLYTQFGKTVYDSLLTVGGQNAFKLNENPGLINARSYWEN